MTDLVYVAVIIALFTMCVLYVNWCDRIVGTDDSPATPAASRTRDEVSV